MTISWSQRALKQLRAAHEYIYQNDPQAAREFVEATDALGELLRTYPNMGIATDAPEVKVFPLVRYRYLVFYKILGEQEVRIMRIRHAARKTL